MEVKKRNNRLEKFSVEKINACAIRACSNLSGVNASELILDANIQFFDKIRTSDIDKTLILTARNKIYQDYNWSIVASRILRYCLYKEVLKESVTAETFINDYKSSFIKNIKKYIKLGLLDKRLEKYDLIKLSEAIDIKKDDIIGYVGIQNIYDRYLLRYEDKVIETPQAFYMRVAMGLCINEENFNERAIDLYHVYSQHLACPSTPTLFNSGTINNQLISCYLSRISDSIDGIFDGLWQEARKSKFAGGLGFHVSGIRAAGSNIKGTQGKSSGLVPWLKVYNDMLVACDQGGKRPGAGCAYIEPWHKDINDFLDLRKANGEERRRCHDLNTALWCPDLFFKRVKENGKWTIFCPSETPELPELFGEEFEKKYSYYEKKAEKGELKNYEILDAKDLWKKILRSLFETSHPWICFKDSSNYRYSNIHEGVVYGSNLCTEIDLHSKSSKYKDGEKIEIGETATCVLGSICLPNHLIQTNNKYKIDYKKLQNTIEKVVRALDNIIDLNYYPTKEAQKSSLKHRPIGMGTMGWADVFARMEISQDSPEAIDFANELTEFISFHAIKTSNQLAKERGKYETFDGSKWSKGELPIDTYNSLCKYREVKPISGSKMEWDKLRELIIQDGMRNSNVMAIAPNASIAYQVGCEQSIEPFFSMLFRYENKSGNYYIVNKNFIDDMKKEGLWNKKLAEQLKEVDGDVGKIDIPQKYKDIYKTAFEINQFNLIKINEARQKWICQSISFNLYNGGKQSLVDGKPSLKFLNDIYLYANECNLKSTYYLRNKAASDIAKVTNEQIKTSEVMACSLEAMKNGGTCESCEG